MTLNSVKDFESFLGDHGIVITDRHSESNKTQLLLDTGCRINLYPGTMHWSLQGKHTTPTRAILCENSPVAGFTPTDREKKLYEAGKPSACQGDQNDSVDQDDLDDALYSRAMRIAIRNLSELLRFAMYEDMVIELPGLPPLKVGRADADIEDDDD